MAYIGAIFPIPVGQSGLVGTKDQGSIDPDKLIIARNLSYYGLTTQKEGGASKYNTAVISGAPSVIAGWDFWPVAGVQRMVLVTSDGKILKDSGAATFPTTLASGLTLTNSVPVFVEGGLEASGRNRKLFCFTGANAVQVLSADAATTTALATPPADWSAANQPTFGCLHENRLFGGGNLNDPHRLYFSQTADQENFTGAGTGTLSIYPGEGERLVGALSFKGLLIAWKFPVGIYLVDTSDPNIANWRVSRLSKSIGGVSPHGGVAIDNDVVFIDPAANIHLLSAVNEFGDIGASNLTRQNHIYSFIQDNLSLARLAFTRGIYYPAKRELHFAMAGLGAGTNNVRFVLDFNRGDMVRFRYSDRDTCESLWLKKDASTTPRLTAGDNVGFVWNLDQTVKSKDGLGYSGSFQTPYMDFSWINPKYATMRKIGQFLEMEVAPTGNWNLSVDVFWDGNYTQTVSFNMGVSGSILGSFTLGTDKLAGDQIITRKRRITGSGRRISLAGVNSGAGEDFSVGKFYLHCLISDERPGREG